MDGRVQIDVDPDEFQSLSGNLSVALGVYEFSLLEEIRGESNVLRNGKIGDEGEVLKDDLDTLGYSLPGGESGETLVAQNDGP